MTRKLNRLYVDIVLFIGQQVRLAVSEAHYLTHVLRLTIGDSLYVFNTKEGEWRASIMVISKKEGVLLQVEEFHRAPEKEIPLSLFFTPLRSGPLGFLIEKATELGVTDFYPFWSERTQRKDFKLSHYQTIAREASEQSRRMNVPIFHAALTLNEVLTKWISEESLWVSDERGCAQSLFHFLQAERSFEEPISLMIGPEGGFSTNEFYFMKEYPFVVFFGLGKHILRAETAALSALALIHAGRT